MRGTYRVIKSSTSSSNAYARRCYASTAYPPNPEGQSTLRPMQASMKKTIKRGSNRSSSRGQERSIGVVDDSTPRGPSAQKAHVPGFKRSGSGPHRCSERHAAWLSIARLGPNSVPCKLSPSSSSILACPVYYSSSSQTAVGAAVARHHSFARSPPSKTGTAA